MCLHKLKNILRGVRDKRCLNEDERTGGREQVVEKTQWKTINRDWQREAIQKKYSFYRANKELNTELYMVKCPLKVFKIV